MRNRKRNNIVIGTLCSVLVLMGVGYAILSTTLNIGGTANIKGDFDIHFTNIQRSSSTITDSTLLSTMDEGTGIKDGTNNHEGTFTAVLQKPTDYVIYEVEVANTGSIDGYLTFTFGDKHSNFDYYKDFYSVEFIRDDVDPDISTDILQNGTFTDNEVLVNTTGTRTYKIKVTFKENATSFPDATTNGDFECSLNLTYSQQAPSQGGSGEQSGVTTYTTTINDPNDNDYNGELFSITLTDEQVGTKTITHYIVGTQDIAPMLQQNGISFVPYDSNITFTKNYLGLTPTTGDYVVVDDDTLMCVLRGDVIYAQIEPRSGSSVQQLTPAGSSSENNEQQPVETQYTFRTYKITTDIPSNWYYILIEDGKGNNYLSPYAEDLSGNDVTQSQMQMASGTLIPFEKVAYTGANKNYYVYNTTADANAGDTSKSIDTILISPSTAYSMSMYGNSDNYVTDNYLIIRINNINLSLNSEALYSYDSTFDATKINFNFPTN